MPRSALLFVIAIAMWLIGCGPSGSPKSPAPRKPAYRQNFRSPIAFLSIERGGQDWISGSAFVIDRQKGIFETAKHVTDAADEGAQGRFKILTNGYAYDAYTMHVLPLRDVALVRIDGAFDPKDLSDPYPIATRPVRVGDTVFVEGAHPHPQLISESNAREGYPDTIVPILEDYYGVVMHDPLGKSEISFDRLEARVIEVGVRRKIRHEGDETEIDAIRLDTNTYIHVRTVRNHKFSFGGLSGGPVLNDRGEVVGLNTAEAPAHFRIELPSANPKQFPEKGAQVRVEKVVDDLYITPIHSADDLLDYAARAQ